MAAMPDDAAGSRGDVPPVQDSAATSGARGGPGQHHAAAPSGAPCHQYDFGSTFALPSVRTSLPSPATVGRAQTRPRMGMAVLPEGGGMLPITPMDAGGLDAMSFIIPDGPEQLCAMQLDGLQNLFMKPEPLSPLMPSSWGMFEQQSVTRQPTAHEAVAIQKWLARAKELQDRAAQLWEQEEAELQRGALLNIINPAPQQRAAILESSPAHPAPSSAMHLSNTLSSPNSMAFWRTMQGLSPTCLAEVRLLDSTPTKSALVDL